MHLEINGEKAYASTGGRSHQKGRPWIIFLHGAGHSHLSWIQQVRAFAYDGWNVLAPDLPGHNLSKGAPIGDIEGQADWVLKLMDAAGAKAAVLVGHSQGGLIALEMAARAPERVSAIVFIATAAAIPVNPALIETAENAEEKAFVSMTSWGLGPEAHINDNAWPGAAHVGAGIDVMRLNPRGTLAADLRSCAAYGGGEAAARGLACPTLCLFAELDRMTAPKNGRALAAALPDNEVVVLAGAGHTLPSERPRQVNAAIRRFLQERLGH